MAIRDMKDPELGKPERPNMERLSALDKEDLKIIYHQQLKDYVKRQGTLEENKKKAFSLILGQFTQEMWSCIKSHDEYSDASDNLDPIKLLKTSKSIVFELQKRKCLVQAVVTQQEEFFQFKQQPGTSLNVFKDRFMDLVDTLKEHQVDLGMDRCLVEQDM